MFTQAEALGLAMAVIEGHRAAADPAELVGGALAKVIRVLPDRVADPVRDALREHRSAAAAPGEPWADPELTVKLLESCVRARRVRVLYRMPPAGCREMELDPWAVVLRHSRWYLLCWSHHRQARRVLRVDRIESVETAPGHFTPPENLDALRTIEDHFSQGWRHPVDVVIDAPVEEVSSWLPRSLGRLEPLAPQGADAAAEPRRTRLRATTDEPDWYARHLASIPVPFRVLGSEPVRAAVAALARKLAQAAEGGEGAAVEGAACRRGRRGR